MDSGVKRGLGRVRPLQELGLVGSGIYGIDGNGGNG